MYIEFLISTILYYLPSVSHQLGLLSMLNSKPFRHKIPTRGFAIMCVNKKCDHKVKSTYSRQINDVIQMGNQFSFIKKTHIIPTLSFIKTDVNATNFSFPKPYYTNFSCTIIFILLYMFFDIPWLLYMLLDI